MNRVISIGGVRAVLCVVLVLILSTACVHHVSTGGENGPKQDINRLLDGWHHAAATADEDVFFGSMTQDAIYLGTDATERWTRTEFETWAKKHFERESAWSFRPYNRTVYFSADGNIAWFEELLETWMGVCRGSGVLINNTEDSGSNGGWKIAHYNLAVLVPNELIDDFIAIFENEPAGKNPAENDTD